MCSTLTAGEAASRGTTETRAREAAAASEIMGLAERRCAGLPDAQVANSHAARQIVAAVVRELPGPRVVVTHWTGGRHPDHPRRRNPSPRRGFPGRSPELSPPRVARTARTRWVYALAFAEDGVKPTFVVDIAEQIERKDCGSRGVRLAAARPEAASGEVFPGGDRPVVEQILSMHAASGSLVRRPYGEPYWTAETTLVDTLGGVGVATF